MGDFITVKFFSPEYCECKIQFEFITNNEFDIPALFIARLRGLFGLCYNIKPSITILPNITGVSYIVEAVVTIPTSEYLALLIGKEIKL